ncbi:hypothetical protein NDU88_000023, partial [Pleurodeles waltl]
RVHRAQPGERGQGRKGHRESTGHSLGREAKEGAQRHSSRRVHRAQPGQRGQGRKGHRESTGHSLGREAKEGRGT